MTSPNLILRIESLSFKWGTSQLFSKLKLDLEASCVYMLRGENASGKSTLLKILAGLQEASDGTVWMDHKSYPLTRAKDKLLSLCTYVHQSCYFFHGSVASNLSYALKGKPITRAKRNALITEALERANLHDLHSKPARTLSGGQQQRLALARAWLRDVKVLLLDEPMSQLDSQSRSDFIDHCATLVQEGRCLVLSSHGSVQEFSLPNVQLKIHNQRLERIDGEND